MTDIVERLRASCVGHPIAEVPWPHRILHEAADEIARLRDAIEFAHSEGFEWPADPRPRLSRDA